MTAPALALAESASIAAGIVAGDAMVKRSPVEVIYAGTIHPGHFLVLVAGGVAEVEEAYGEALAWLGDHTLDSILLPDVDPAVASAVRGTRVNTTGEALGIVETTTVASAIAAADAGVKGAAVVLREIRMGDGLGGKAYLLFGGPVAEVEAAVEIGCGRVSSDRLVGSEVIASLHGEMEENLAADPRFLGRVEG